MTGHAGRCAYGSKEWDDMHENGLKCAYGSKLRDDMHGGAGWGQVRPGVQGARRVVGFEVRSACIWVQGMGRYAQKTPETCIWVQGVGRYVRRVREVGAIGGDWGRASSYGV